MIWWLNNKDSLPGDSPELMPLDSHLFADIKEGVAKNVAFSFFFDDDDPDKYSLRTPTHVFDAIQRTIATGCPSTERIIQDIMKLPLALQRIVEADGCYIDDETTRSGVRRETRTDTERRLRLVDPAVQAKFSAMLDTMFEGNGVPFYRMRPPCDFTEIESVDMVDADGDDNEGAMDKEKDNDTPQLEEQESRSESLEMDEEGSDYQD